jgi:type II secretory ATPase GspE/PulE/Tfp pilus assembly ATPase PilB-like protein
MRLLSDFFPIPEQDRQYPLEYIENNSVIKLYEDDSVVKIGLTENEALLKEELKSFHNKVTEFINIEKNDLSAYLAKKLSSRVLTTSGILKENDERHKLDKLANDAPVINLVNSIIMDAVTKGASDIHIESFLVNTSVRFRIDGFLYMDRNIENNLFPAISSRIKIMGNLNIMERRLPQDGRITVKMSGFTVDIRVSIVPINKGESIVLRLLNKKSIPLSLKELGFSELSVQMISTLYTKPHGLILLTGPTGSGKTTTLNSIIRELNDPSVKIITIEDPVEYEINGVDQIQTDEKIGLTFDSILRRVLRQDPNIIMIGEIRDKATAELAVRASMTGHLVLSTVHTNDSVSVLHRLINMGIEPYMLAGVLRGAIAQRLVRRLCDNCKTQDTPSLIEKKLLAENNLKTEKVYRASRCESCGGSGYSGRLVISEAFLSDEELEDKITDGVKTLDIQNYLFSKGMVKIHKDGLMKAVNGLTTIGEVEKAVLI